MSYQTKASITAAIGTATASDKGLVPPIGTPSGRFLKDDNTWAAPVATTPTITLSGDATGSGTTSIAVTLKNTGPGAGTIGNATLDAQGRVTAYSAPVTSLVANLPMTVSGSTGAVTIAGDTVQRLTGNYTNATTGPTNIFTGITSVANAVYRVEAQITTQCSSTGGNKFSIVAPTGSTVEGWFYGTTSAVATLSSQRITAINTLSSTAMNTVATTPAPLTVSCVVTTSSTTGTITIAGADVTSGQTNTVFAGSSLRITRIA
jgi:hypothetical protein